MAADALFFDHSLTSYGDYQAAFAKFETQIRNAVIEEAAGVAEKYATEATPHGFQDDHHIGTEIAASIRQLRERAPTPTDVEKDLDRG